MKRLILTTAIAALAGSTLLTGSLLMSGSAYAKPGDDYTVIADFSRRPAGSTSGSGHTVGGECAVDPAGNLWQGATASLKIGQSTGASKVEIEVEGAAPNTLFTVWVRVFGKSHGTDFGRSPVTNGGATPLAHSSALGSLIADWIGAGSATQANGFTTDSDGEGVLTLNLDFPVVGGAYPFNRMTAADLVAAQGKRAAALASPTALVNPADANIDAPFMIRMVSHCQDGLGHGLSPSKREAWFQYP